MICSACRTDNPDLARYCSRCAAPLSGLLEPSEGDATGGVIPYKNPPALAAYYLGLFSIFPVLGIVLGVAAVILGKKGLDNRKLNPKVRGIAHAWVGIGCGTLSILAWGAVIVMMVVGIVAG